MRRPFVILPLGLLIIIALVLLLTRPSPDATKLSQAEFIGMVQSNLLIKVRVYYPARRGQVDGVSVMLNDVRGTFYPSEAAGQSLKAHGIPAPSAFVARVQLTPELEGKLLTMSNTSIVQPHPVVWKAVELFKRSR